MTKSTDRIEALADTANDWRDPDHPPRSKAVEETLDVPNRWTEQALSHALDRWMHRITIEALGRWIGEEVPPESVTVGVLHGSSGPFAGLRAALATWALGHNYVGAVPASSPALLPAFAEEVKDRLSDIEIRFTEEETLYPEADFLLAHSRDSIDSVEDACSDHDIPPSRRLIWPPVYSIGIVDGHESDDEMERLAEDMLLFEGEGRRRLAILWAPRDHSPDPYLQAMARFRGLFPAHQDTPGTLQMQQAFLEARDEPHAYADGLEFLVSRGEPTPQRPGHIRWSEYDDLTEVADWLADEQDEVYAVIARRHLHDQLPVDHTLRTPGGVHVPPLDDEEGRRIVSFLRKGHSAP